jgi:hypothetical protein
VDRCEEVEHLYRTRYQGFTARHFHEQAGDVLMVTRLDRLARSTRDLLNTLADITGKGAGFRSLGWPGANGSSLVRFA